MSDMMRVFISHSAQDSDIAAAVIRLLRSGLNLKDCEIRCTSVTGYKLPSGSNFDEQLRRETNEAEALIGLLTYISGDSGYVLFELGARWGAKKKIFPLLAAGAGPDVLSGPLQGINAMKCERGDLLQLVRDVGEELDLTAGNPEAYLTDIDHLISVSRELEHERTQALRDEATSLPDELSEAEKGRIMMAGSHRNEGEILAVFVEGASGREETVLADAVRQLCERKLMRRMDETYILTSAGWEKADQLWSVKILEALAVFPDDYHDQHTLSGTIDTDEPIDSEDLDRLTKSLGGDELVTIGETMSDGWSAMITNEGLTYLKRNRIG